MDESTFTMQSPWRRSQQTYGEAHQLHHPYALQHPSNGLNYHPHLPPPMHMQMPTPLSYATQQQQQLLQHQLMNLQMQQQMFMQQQQQQQYNIQQQQQQQQQQQNNPQNQYPYNTQTPIDHPLGLYSAETASVMSSRAIGPQPNLSSRSQPSSRSGSTEQSDSDLLPRASSSNISSSRAAHQTQIHPYPRAEMYMHQTTMQPNPLQHTYAPAYSQHPQIQAGQHPQIFQPSFSSDQGYNPQFRDIHNQSALRNQSQPSTTARTYSVQGEESLRPKRGKQVSFQQASFSERNTRENQVHRVGQQEQLHTEPKPQTVMDKVVAGFLLAASCLLCIPCFTAINNL